jgi:hypothetical protein
MDTILSQTKQIEHEAEKGFSWKKSKRHRVYTHTVKPSIIIEKVSKEEKELEYRRKQLEHYLSDLRAIYEPDESLGVIEDFLENFEPRNKEEEMMVSSIWKQLDRVKETREE